jgi:hypothetical protein
MSRDDTHVNGSIDAFLQRIGIFARNEAHELADCLLREKLHAPKQPEENDGRRKETSPTNDR